MTNVLLPVTLVTAGGLALINFWLGIRIGQVRRSAKISVGDGGHEPLVRRMRAQANFVEFAPFVLALIGLIELNIGGATWLWVVASAFLVARVLHGFGMDGWGPGRTIGTAVTMLVMVGLALYAISLPLLARRQLAPTAADVTAAVVSSHTRVALG